MKALWKIASAPAALSLLFTACASAPHTDTISLESATEEVEEFAVHTFNDPREDALIEADAWVWPEDENVKRLVERNESIASITQRADSPDRSPYLEWKTETDFDRQRFPEHDADIGRRVRFSYSPLFAYIR